MTQALDLLLQTWEQRLKQAPPVDAMLINRHIRELREVMTQPDQPKFDIESALDRCASTRSIPHDVKVKIRAELQAAMRAQPMQPVLDAGPAAYMVFWGIGEMRPHYPAYNTREIAELAALQIKSITEVRALYTANKAMQPVQPTTSAPGWKLVPIAPTPEMLQAGGHVNSEWLNDNAPIGESRYILPMTGVYAAMLESAPVAQPVQPATVTQIEPMHAVKNTMACPKCGSFGLCYCARYRQQGGLA